MNVDARDAATVLLVVVCSVLCVLLPVMTHFRFATPSSLRRRVLYGLPGMVILQTVLAVVICGGGLLMYARLSSESPAYWSLAALNLSAMGSAISYVVRYVRVRHLLEDEAQTAVDDDAG